MVKKRKAKKAKTKRKGTAKKNKKKWSTPEVRKWSVPEVDPFDEALERSAILPATAACTARRCL